ncbi:MAG TPA: metalloregulator ArsR/SmtB family transcription factor [Streptosporangiaceae bacterium]|nr:metalloregulator ArsR/SmtB family transcription factor [Streptosporangiaceae bacterium]
MRKDTPAGSDVAVVFGALADPARRQVVELLGQSPRRAGELAAAVGLSAPAMSRHLRVLLEAGIVADERTARDARLRYFRLRPTSMVAMQAWLDQLQAHFDEQLASFKRHVDQQHLGGHHASRDTPRNTRSARSRREHSDHT